MPCTERRERQMKPSNKVSSKVGAPQKGRRRKYPGFRTKHGETHIDNFNRENHAPWEGFRNHAGHWPFEVHQPGLNWDSPGCTLNMGYKSNDLEHEITHSTSFNGSFWDRSNMIKPTGCVSWRETCTQAFDDVRVSSEQLLWRIWVVRPGLRTWKKIQIKTSNISV